MADEETPFDDLDIGYVEWPMPTTEEFTVIRFLTKEGVARLWAKIGDKFFRIPYGGEPGQALFKTQTGYSWQDVLTGNFIEEPSGGTVGQALVKTETGVGWSDVETDIPEASDTEYGTVRFATDEEFDSYFTNPQGENVHLLDNKAVSLYQLKRLLTGKPAKNLPEGYIELEYIDIPAEQYVSTEIKTNQNTKITMTVILLVNPSTTYGSFFFGSSYPTQSGNGIECYTFYNLSEMTPKINAVFNGTMYFAPGLAYKDDKLHIDWHNQILTIFQNDSLVCNYAWPSDTYTSAANLTLYGLARTGTVYSGNVRVYDTKVYDNKTLVLDLIPAKKTSGELGFYNLVNGTFYENSGNGAFIGGPEIDREPWTGLISVLSRTKIAIDKRYGNINFDPYIRLEYIEMSGGPIIDTGFKPNNNTRVYLKIKSVQSNQDYAAIFGGRTSSTSASFSLWIVDDDFFRFDYGTLKKEIHTNALGDFVIDINKNSISINGNISTTSSQTFQSKNSIRIGSNVSNSETRRFVGKIYYYKIFNNGDLVRDLIPVKMKEDGRIGLYDRVHNTFYGNIGTGSIVGGPEI